jgi:glutamate N-acetyltransferase/amino-acid N-acetyltransferase
MIAPNMGTMLGLVLTDAPIAAADLQKMLSTVVDETFNCVSVDGHMSTNDTVLLLANGAAGGRHIEGRELPPFRTALSEVCAELARAIPADGEGATHLITLEVTGCATPAGARQIARTVADSPLVKTAIAASTQNMVWPTVAWAVEMAGGRKFSTVNPPRTP